MIGRRTLIKAGAIGAGAALLPPCAHAIVPSPLLLIDDRLSPAERALAPFGSASRLETEVVRQWRRDLSARFADGARGLAFVRWDKALLLAGLARDDGLPVRHRKIGHTTFLVEIGQTDRTSKKQ